MRIGATARFNLARHEPGSRQPCSRNLHDEVVVREGIGGVLPRLRNLDGATRLGRRRVRRIDDLLGEHDDLGVNEAANLQLHRAPIGYDVALGPAVDHANAARSPGPDAAHAEARQGDRSSVNRIAPVFGGDAGMRRLAAELEIERDLARRAHRHRARVAVNVVDVPDGRLKLARVERLGADETDLFLHRDHELDARVRDAVAHDAADAIDDPGDRRLVIGTEDRRVTVDDELAFDHGIDRRGHRNGIDMRVEEQRRAGSRRGDAGVEVAGITVDLRPRVVLDALHAERRQDVSHHVDRRALLAGWRGQAGELEK